jgi:phage-related protein
MKIIKVVFYCTPNGSEPVRKWLMTLDQCDKKTIGTEIKTVEFGWPIGMPLVRKMENLLWEVRVDISDKRIARVLFTVVNSKMVLLHGFIKKQQKTPEKDIDLAKERLKKTKSSAV